MVSKYKYNIILGISVGLILVACIISYIVGYKRYIEKYDSQIKNNTYQYNEVVSADSTKDLLDSTESNEVVAVNSGKISNKTIYTVIEIDRQTNKTTKKSQAMPLHFIGLSRGQMVKYYEYYMNHLPREEMEKGLVEINVVEFSDDRVVTQKIYDITSVLYYITEDDGYVKVFYADKKTLYENTGILIDELPDIEKKNIENGMFVKDKDELISILEGYSS